MILQKRGDLISVMIEMKTSDFYFSVNPEDCTFSDSLIGKENENCFKLNASLSGRSSLDSTLVKSRQLTGQAANYLRTRIWQMAAELKIQTTFPICLQTF